MSETDSFIEEVSQEVRRDRLFALMRRYGWIAVLLIVVIVGGASYNEWRKASARAAAQERGDAIIAALSLEDATARVEALAALTAEGDLQAVLHMLTSAEQLAAGDRDGAVARLQTVSADPELSDIYSQLAELKLVMLQADDLSVDTILERLGPLAAAGAPYRLLAEEQMAVAEVAAGRRAAAIARLQALLDDAEVTTDLRRRATQLIVALGGQPVPA